MTRQQARELTAEIETVLKHRGLDISRASAVKAILFGLSDASAIEPSYLHPIELSPCRKVRECIDQETFHADGN